MVHDSHPLRNIDSITSSALNHCFKISGPGDFFNTLGYQLPN